MRATTYLAHVSAFVQCALLIIYDTRTGKWRSTSSTTPTPTRTPSNGSTLHGYVVFRTVCAFYEHCPLTKPAPKGDSRTVTAQTKPRAAGWGRRARQTSSLTVCVVGKITVPFTWLSFEPSALVPCQDTGSTSWQYLHACELILALFAGHGQSTTNGASEGVHLPIRTIGRRWTWREIRRRSLCLRDSKSCLAMAVLAQTFKYDHACLPANSHKHVPRLSRPRTRTRGYSRDSA